MALLRWARCAARLRLHRAMGCCPSQPEWAALGDDDTDSRGGGEDAPSRGYEPWRPGDMLSVRCITWNMAGMIPPDGAAADILAHSDPGGDGGGAHIVAFGSQECLRSIEMSLVLPSCHWQWEQALSVALGRHYRRVGGASVGGTHICCFARADVARWIAPGAVDAASVATGPMGAANKGGAGVCFYVGSPEQGAVPLSLLFISAHLSHGEGEERAARRRSDWSTICSDMPLGSLGSSELWREPPTRMATDARDVSAEFDVAVMLGDCNSRTSTDFQSKAHQVAQDALRGSAAAQQELLQHDELLPQLAASTGVWSGWAEAPVTFAPTYKFSRDKDNRRALDVYAPGRIPSWTDRVVVRSTQPVAAELSGYTSCRVEGSFSDHLPVALSLTIATRKIDPSTTGEFPKVLARQRPGGLGRVCCWR